MNNISSQHKHLPEIASSDLTVLLLEDNEFDAELVLAELELAGYVCTATQVASQKDFQSALGNGCYDIVLADYNLPSYDGLTALHDMHEWGYDYPLILVSGQIGEEFAIESLKAGATDYVLKTRLSRLGHVVARTLKERNEARQKRKLEARLRLKTQAIESTDSGVVIFDVQTQAAPFIYYVNSAFESITGYTAEEIVGLSCTSFIERKIENQTSRLSTEQLIQYQSTLALLCESIPMNKNTHANFQNYHKEGTPYACEVSLSPIHNHEQQFTHVVGIVNDVTERKQMEERARQQDRLAVIGQLASGVAHDFNNILTIISMNAEMLQRQLALSEREQRRLRTIKEQSTQAANLINQILDYSRQSISDMRPIDIIPLLTELCDLLRRTLPKTIDIHFEPHTKAVVIQGDVTKLHQIFMNLAINARDALKGQGRLQLTATKCMTLTLPNSTSYAKKTATGHGWLQIDVTDTGEGIAPESQPHIFEPFFTTKLPGKGTGLGLAQVYGLVEQHAGAIDIKSSVGVGTTFSLFFPIIQAVPIEQDTDTPALSVMGNGETILVIEDNKETRNALVDALTELNYRVQWAANGQDALTICQATINASADAQIAAVISDIIMPHMDGGMFAKQFRTIAPETPIIILTGYAYNETIKRLRLLNNITMLTKPIKMSELAATLAKVLKPKSIYYSLNA